MSADIVTHPTFNRPPPVVNPAAGAPPKPGIAKRLEEQRDRVYEVGAIVALVAQTLRAFSGDEESALDIVERLSTQCFALDGAYRLTDDVNQQLELIGRDLE